MSFDEVVELSRGDDQPSEVQAEAATRSGDDLQFYVTPDWLADVVHKTFKDRDFERVLDACAGTGALGKAFGRHEDSRDYRYSRRIPVDCVEIDPRHHAGLRKNFKVVGLDFLEFTGGECYSHIVLNPPFRRGVVHVLKAWDILYSGEVVAILNAETVRNVNSKERTRLAKLIRDHGSVQFFEGAFSGRGVERAAEVEVAVVHLIKPAEESGDWIGPVIASMAADKTEHHGLELPRELTLPRSFIENQCIAFGQAVKSMREAVKMEAVAAHFSERIGKTMAESNGKGADEGTLAAMRTQGDWVRQTMRERYDELKDRAWTSVLRSTETLSRLSRKVQQQAESRFEEIKTLDFTASNIYAFLLGLVESRTEMQMEMMCDVFDQVVKYHLDNACWYKGWVSNSKQRTCGMRLKTTRFIIPGHRVESYQRSVSYDTVQQLADFDKVFAILDGKEQPPVSLTSVFQHSFEDLKSGKRVSASYFDVRFYPQAGTIHFFPRRADLVDRLNRLVGRQRAWVPPPETKAETFWKQFAKAEKFDAEFRAAVSSGVTIRRWSRWDDPLYLWSRGGRSGDDEKLVQAHQAMNSAMDKVLEAHGLLDALTMEEAQQALAEGARQGEHAQAQLPLLTFDEAA